MCNQVICHDSLKMIKLKYVIFYDKLSELLPIHSRMYNTECCCLLLYVNHTPIVYWVKKAVVDVLCNLQRVVFILQRVVDMNQ